jgi:hypothetical protein
MIKGLKEKFKDQSGICFYDLSAAMKDFKDRAYTDSGHLNALGNEVMAKRILGQVINCGLL